MSPPNSDPDIDDLIEDLMATVRSKLLVAYARGERSGRAAARDAIMRAVGDAGDDDGRIIDVVEPRRGYTSRLGPVKAPRGLVSRTIRDVLSASPGLPVTEIEERVTALQPVISSKSVGNELRRQENILYRREGKYAWFLMPRPETETARSHDDLADLLGSVPKGGEGS